MDGKLPRAPFEKNLLIFLTRTKRVIYEVPSEEMMGGGQLRRIMVSSNDYGTRSGVRRENPRNIKADLIFLSCILSVSFVLLRVMA
jgi:hypothetical protein